MRCCFAALLFVFAPFLAQAQDIPPVGDAASFDVATWNIEWFGSTGGGPSNEDRQFENVLAVLRAAEIDLWALQEVTSTSTFNRLLDSLGTGWEGTLAEEPNNQQRTAYVWRTDVVTLTSSPRQVLDSESFKFAGRPPLRIDFEATAGGRTQAYVAFTIHAKCCGDSDDKQRRADGANALKGYIDALLSTSNVIVLGDFNDELRTSISGGDTPYRVFLDDTDAWQFLTIDFDLAGSGGDTRTYCRNSSCSSGSVLDHILVTNEAATLYISDSVGRYDALLDAFDATGEFVFSTSDHLPVYARFDFPPGVPNEDDGTLPTTVTLGPAAPNPFTGTTALTYALPRTAPVQIEVYDMLGRRVRTLVSATRPAGTHTVRFSADALPPGLYLVRLTADGTTTVRRVVLMS